MRDDFTNKVKSITALRVGYRCSNPNCRALTSGPQSNINKTLNLGVAAHITAASTKGPRYDPNLKPEQRKDLNNCIWLCQNCAKLIDNDPNHFSETLLRQWKEYAETEASNKLEKQNP